MGQNGVSMQQQQAIYGQPRAFAATGDVSATALTPSPVQGGVVVSAAGGTLASSVGVAAVHRQKAKCRICFSATALDQSFRTLFWFASVVQVW
jgi:hypothetical protein